MPAFAERTVVVHDGTALRVYDEGEGDPAFLLVHGLASNARMWDGVRTCLAEAGHRAVAVDLRGHGQSDKPDTGYAVTEIAADVRAVIAALSLDRPVVAGQSWGGNVAVELGAADGGSLRGVVCVDGGWIELSKRFRDWESCRQALQPPRLAGTAFHDIERLVREMHGDWPESGIAGALANFEVRSDGTVAPWLTYDRHMTVLRGLWEHRPSELYASVGCPVLLCPADDGTGRIDRTMIEVEAAEKNIPRVRTQWFDGHHDVHAQQPDALAGAMLGALAGGFFE